MKEYFLGNIGLDEIFMQLAEKWDSLTTVQQRYIATQAAGSRQQSRFIALMQNYQRTVELTTAAQNANGSSQEQFEKTLDSLQTKMAQLKDAWHEFLMGITQSDVVKGVIDLGTKALQLINKLINGLSGGNGLAKSIISVATAVGGLTLGKSILNRGMSALPQTAFGRMLGLQAAKAEPKASVWSNIQKNGFFNTDSIATSIAGGIKKGWKDGESSAQEHIRGWGGTIKSVFKNQFSNFFATNDEIKTATINQLEQRAAIAWDEGRQETGDALIGLTQRVREGDITSINKLNGELKSLGETSISVNGHLRTLSSQGLDNIAIGAATTGASILALTTILEKNGQISENAAGILKGVATGLMAFPAVLTVVRTAVQLFATSVSASISSIPIIGWIAAVISAIIALGTAIHNYNQNNSLEHKLEMQQAALEKTKTAAEEAKQNFENLGNAWGKYEAGINKINELTQGTKEYNQAVRESNNEVLELIKLYPELAKTISVSNGRLTINEQDYNKLLGKYRANSDVLNSSVIVETAITEYLEAQKAVNDVLESYRNKEIKNDIIAYGWDTSADAGTQMAQLQGNALVGRRAAIEASDEYKKLEQAFTVDLEPMISAVAAGMTNLFSDEELSNKYFQQIVEAETKERLRLLTNQNRDILQSPELMNAIEKQYPGINFRQFDNNLDVIAKLMGIDTSKVNANEALYNQGLILSIEQNTRETISRMEQIKDETANRVAGAMLTNDFSNISQNEYEKWRNVLSEYYGITTNAINPFKGRETKFLNQTGEDWLNDHVTDELKKELLNTIDQVKFNEIISDKNNWSGIDNITNAIEALKTTCPGAEDALDQLKEQLIALDQASVKINLTKLFETAQTRQALSNEIRGGKTTFTQEEFQEISRNMSAAELAQFAFNGEEYTYLGNSMDQLANAIDNNTAALLGEKYTNARARVDEGEVIETALERLGTKSMSEVINAYIAKDLEGLAKKQNDINSAYNLSGNTEKVTAEVLKSNVEDWIRKVFNDQNLTSDEIEAILTRSWGENGTTYAENAEDMDKSGAATRYGTTFNTLLTEAVSDLENGKLPQELATVFRNGMSSAIQGLQLEDGDISNLNRLLTEVDGNGQYAQSTILEIRREVERLQQLSADRKLVKGWTELTNSLKTAKDELQNLTKGSKEYKLKLQDMNNIVKQFGQNYGFDVPDDFFTDADRGIERLTLLEQSINGNKYAWTELQAELSGNREGWLQGQEELQNLLGDLMSVEDFVNSLDDFTIDGTTTLDVSNLLANAGLAEDELNAVLDALIKLGRVKLTPRYISATLPKTGRYTHMSDEEWGQMQSRVAVGMGGMTANDLTTVDKILVGFDYDVVEPPSGLTTPPPKDNPTGSGGNKYQPKYTKIDQAQQEINQLLRDRNRLESDYQTSLTAENTKLTDIQNNLKKQKKIHEDVQQAYDKAQSAMKKDLTQHGYGAKDNYTIGDKRQTFNAWAGGSMSNYVGISANADGTYNINFTDKFFEDKENGTLSLEAIEAIEAYFDLNKDKIDKINDSVKEQADEAAQYVEKQQEYKEAIADFENKVIETIIAEREKEIDAISNLNDAINESNERLISAMQEQIEADRQARQNEKTEQDIADKQARLDYLRRDTSGANAVAIRQLEKEIAESQQSYEETLVDQGISKLEDANQKAAEQRERQISILQSIFDWDKEHGTFAAQAEQWIKNLPLTERGVDAIVEKLKETEGLSKTSAALAEEELRDMAITVINAITEFLPNGRYASGGLVTATGPAWLDGTPSKPELVLNPAQTQAFFDFQKMLEGFSGKSTIKNAESSVSNFDININVDKIDSDYSVSQMVEQLKQEMYRVGTYRNIQSL